MTRIKQTDGKHNDVIVFCPVNGWDCPYWINHICYRRGPMVNCEDFKRIFKSWEYWEAL